MRPLCIITTVVAHDVQRFLPKTYSKSRESGYRVSGNGLLRSELNVPVEACKWPVGRYEPAYRCSPRTGPQNRDPLTMNGCDSVLKFPH